MTPIRCALAATILLASQVSGAPGDAARMRTLMKDFQRAMMKRDAARGMRLTQQIQALAKSTWLQGDLEPGGIFYLRGHADIHKQLKKPGFLAQVPPRIARASRLPLARAVVWHVAQGNSGSALLVLRDALKIASRAPDPAHAAWLLASNVVEDAQGHREAVLEFLAGAVDKALPDLTHPEKLLRPRARSLMLSEVAQGYRKLRKGGPPTAKLLAEAKVGAELAAKEASLPAARRLLPICFYLSEEFYARLARGEKSSALALEWSLRSRHKQLVDEAGKGAVWGFLSTTLADLYYQRHPEKMKQSLSEYLDGALGDAGALPRKHP